MGQEVQSPLKNHKNIGFLSNTGPDPLKNHKATKPTGRWWADDGPLLVVFESSHQKKVKFVKVGPPPEKLFGSAHALFEHIIHWA